MNSVRLVAPSVVLALTMAIGRPAVAQTCVGNPIAVENCLPGAPSSEWDVSGAGDASIQGFATDISVNPAQTVSFKISSSSVFGIKIYRLGYYQGNGARLVADLGSSFPAQVQSVPPMDPVTGLIDCGGWSESASWTVPSTAVSGIYIAKLTRSGGGSSHIAFIVRDDASTSDLLFKTSDATWQAYNGFGGNSLYVGSVPGFPSGHAPKVSYNRPFTTRGGGGGGGNEDWVFNAEYPMVRWLEANGYDVTYTTDVDADRRGNLVANHKVFLSVGHDEYWSAGERAYVQAARDAGTHLAFFSGNEIYWKTRWEPSDDGSSTPYRTLVCYKEGTLGENQCGAKCDPLSNVWTGLWRDGCAYSPPADGCQPENALSGQISWDGSTSSLQVSDAYKSLRFWRNTAVAALGTGQTLTLPYGTLGYEWDWQQYTEHYPAGRVLLSTTNFNGKTHHLSLYRAPSGALVFGAGTVQWSWGLDGNHDRGNEAPSLVMQQATVNLFADMGAQPASLQTGTGLVAATSSGDNTPPASVIGFPAPGASLPAGTPATINGTATEAGGLIMGVEVSVDGGATWLPATGTTNWSYAWTPAVTGIVTIKSRAHDDLGNLENPGAGPAANVVTVTVTPGSPSDPPVVTATAPGNGATGVPGNAAVAATFSKDLDPLTVTTATFELRDPLNALVTASVEYDVPSRTATLTPGVLLAPSTIFTARLAGGATDPRVKDLAGTAMSADYSWSFTTTAPDNAPPTVNSTAPANGAGGVSPAVVVTAVFNEGLTPSTVNASTFELRGPAPATTLVPATVAYSVYTNTATLTPTAPLAAGTYTARVVGGTTDPRIKDLAGNALAADDIWTFSVLEYNCPCTIFAPATLPNVVDAGDPNAVEVGVKLRADMNGYLTGIRYYKGAANGGTHVGRLWTTAGVQLGNATFTGESASGWQEASFTTPIAITSGTTYVASVHMPQGHYSDFINGFQTGVDSPPLHALANGVDGPNGVYRYGAGGVYPTDTYQSSNYYVDVVYATSVGPDVTPPTVTVVSPTNGATAVSIGANVTATFNEPIDPATLDGTTFDLRDPSAALVPATVSYDTLTRTATLDPTEPLASSTTYTATVKGGGTDPRIKDVVGNALAADVTWTFTTDVPDVTPPVTTALSPTNGASGVVIGTTVSATFNEAIDLATVSGSTFELRAGVNPPVAATVSYNAGTRTATLVPTSPLAYSTTYTATLKGGGADPRIKDVAGNALAADQMWSFTTSAAPPPPPDEGAGGPILVVASSGNPFGRYFAEILRAEGLTGFLVTDVSLLSPALLNAHDVVILGETPLSAAQVTMLDDWVNAGGTLVASRPDKQLAGLLGLTDASVTLANQYLAVNAASAPGTGIVGASIQFHGTADLYTLNGAEALATLYSNATTPTPNPAATLRLAGSNGGRAMAFTYDLARSIVYTRQGNPAWADDERDGIGPLRSDDMFYGAKAGDVQPDWIDLNKVAIPQADEQQRLLVNMILKGNLHRMPLPRFWHFPKGKKAVVIMTGDDHGAGGTAGRMTNELAASSPGCSVDDWECIRSSSYVEGGVSTLNDANVASFTAQGFEVGIHFDTGCANYTPAELRSVYTNMQAWFAARFPSAPPPSSNRTHCIAWSGWATQAEVEVENGIRLDVNYYFWPPGWVQNRPGMFTGSGMPMRFARTDGSMIDCYQAVTQMTDESGQDLAMTINALLDGALDTRGYYGAFTANMHTDNAAHGGWSAIVAAAQARNVPVVSGRQMLTWLDGRNGSQFQSLNWNGTTKVLGFTLAIGAGARNLIAMVPTQGPVGSLTGITRGGVPIAYTTETIKGIEYAFFPAVAGPHEAQYLVDTTAPLISAVTATPLNDGTASITWTTTEPADSRVDYGTDPEALATGPSSSALVTSHALSLTGLTPNVTYYYRVTSADAASNSATSPEPPAAPASFTTPPPPCFEDLTAAQFGLGSFGAGTYLSVTTDGEVTLAPAVSAEFNGMALDAGWQALLWQGGSATVSVSGGQLTLNGARVNPEPYTPVTSGHTLEFVATFTGAEYQHVGFGAGQHSPPGEIYNTTPWAMFSTNGGGVLQARTHNGAGGLSDFGLSAGLLNAPHRYRIDWLASQVDYYVDGSLVRSEPIAVGGTMRPATGDYTTVGSPLLVNWIRMSPYSSAGTFTSRVFDALGTSNWGVATYSADLPAGTSVALSVRKGATPVPDGTWTPWTGVANGGAVGGSSRYIQYQAALATTDVSVTPALRDVVVSCGVTPDVDPPVISAVVATPGGGGTTATVTWTTDEMATSLVAYGTSAGLLDQNASTAGQAVSHWVALTGLSPSTTYYYRVTSADGSSNSATSPVAPATLSFTTAAGDCFADRVVADFTAGSPGANTAVSAAGDGAVTLKAALDESFGGTTLPAGWSTYSWNPGSTAIVAGGSLTVDGLRANPEPFTAGPGSSLEFVATFASDALQHAGFGGGNQSIVPVVFNSYPWAMFSTGSSGGVLMARVVTAGGPEINSLIPGSWLGAPHTFRIDWDATEFRFWIDGVLRHTQATPISDPMRPAVSDYTTGAGVLVVDWMRLLSYPASGTFASRIYHAGVTSSWGAATWTATLPAGTSLAISTRRGNTPTPDGTWTAFTPVPSSGSVVGGSSRYIQYSATLATTNPQVTPALDDLVIACTAAPPDVTPPVISSVAASPGVNGTTATVTWTTDEAATSRVDYGTSPGSLTLNAENLTLTLSHSVPLSGLAPGTTYYYRVTSQDAASNSATSPEPPATLSFTTPVLCPADQVAANLALGTPDANTAVSSTVGDGAVVLRRTVDEDFSGTALPSGWLSGAWQGGGSLVVGGGQITADGWRADPPQDFSAGATMEFVATFNASNYQHVGFYTGGGSFTTYILIGTSGTTNTIFARATGTPTEGITIGGAELIGTPHLYRIEWKTSSVDYFVDGVLKATQPLAHAGPLKASISDYDPGGPALSVDWLSITPYLSPGTFLSRVFDQGGQTSWGALSYTATTPAGTSVSTSVRIGNTPTPDGSWTAFVPVANGGNVGGGSRYLQYRADLASSDPAATPALQDIAIACTPGGDVTPPVINSIVATPGAGGTTAGITWNTDEPATSRVDYGTSPGDLSLNSSSPLLVSAHTLSLASLTPSTVYYYRVTSVDFSGNSATSPMPPATLSFVTAAPPPSVCAQDQTAAHFVAGTLSNTIVTQVADGEVTLAPTLQQDFDGTSLPSGWQAAAWGGGSTPTVSGGVLTLNGGHAATTATFGSGSSIEFVATFRGEVNQHIGLTADFDFNAPWAIFSTMSSTSGLYARVNSPGGSTDSFITGSGSLIGSAHRYRIDWKSASFEFYVDGVLVSTIPRTISSTMVVHGSDLPGGPLTLTLDWIRATPYITPGTFNSRIHDGGASVSWKHITWTSTLPAGTSLAISVRTGNTATPDGTWTAFTPIAASGDQVGQVGRYLQYRATLGTTDPGHTPALLDLSVRCGPPPECAVDPDCNDGNACTTDTCDSGFCSHAVRTNGSVCSDGNACTQTDTCQAGTCTGSNPVVCNASDQCHVAGTCDTGTGVCSNPARSDGTSCSDGNACTQTDTCQAGACTGGSTVVCVASDQCHVAGTCDTGTGLCSNPAESDGKGCDDNNPCTQTDTCQAGVCTGANPVTCPTPDVCHDPGVCNTATGACSNPVKPDGATCEDGNPCTTDQCSAGTCVHTASGACGVSGSVLYYLDASLAEPSTEAVPDVAIDASGDSLPEDTTNGSGDYTVGSLYGSITVRTLEKLGSPRASDHNGAISSLDASAVARAAVGRETLSVHRFTAGDVTGNRTISALDASYIARFAVSLVDHFPVATTSDWKFFVCDPYGPPANPGCVDPIYTFLPIAQPETARNFYAVLYGEVTGNWVPAGSFASSRAAASAEEGEAIARDRDLAERLGREGAPEIERPAGMGPAELSLGGSTKPLRAGERRQLTIDLRNADGILGLDLTLTYDPARIAIVSVQPSGIGSQLSLAQATGNGTRRIAAYGYVPLSGSGPVLTVTVQALRNTGAQAPVRVGGVANEGEVPLRERERVVPPRMGRSL